MKIHFKIETLLIKLAEAIEAHMMTLRGRLTCSIKVIDVGQPKIQFTRRLMPDRPSLKSDPTFDESEFKQNLNDALLLVRQFPLTKNSIQTVLFEDHVIPSEAFLSDWDQSTVYPSPSREWSAKHPSSPQNGLATTDTVAECLADLREWIAFGGVL